jgi:TetR/AcrR family transcriptional regulator
MSEQEKKTEEQIFDAAHKVFVIKGFDGARMQDIADEAKINKALLHYYYRTKEKLFDAIFDRVFKNMFPRVFKFMGDDSSITSKIEQFVDVYIDLISNNPFIPSFVINELNRNPQRLVDIIGHKTGLIESNAFAKFSKVVEDEVAAGKIKPVKAEHLIVNIIALCIFPIIAKPIVQGVLFENDKKRYQAFLSERKQEVTRFIIQAISK